MQFPEELKILREHEADLRKMGIKALFVFGSVARGEHRPDSDVDLFFDHDHGAISVFGLMDIEEKASEWLGRRADVTSRDGIHPLIRQQVEKAALQVF